MGVTTTLYDTAKENGIKSKRRIRNTLYRTLYRSTINHQTIVERRVYLNIVVRKSRKGSLYHLYVEIHNNSSMK